MALILVKHKKTMGFTANGQCYENKVYVTWDDFLYKIFANPYIPAKQNQHLLIIIGVYVAD